MFLQNSPVMEGLNLFHVCGQCGPTNQQLIFAQSIDIAPAVLFQNVIHGLMCQMIFFGIPFRRVRLSVRFPEARNRKGTKSSLILSH